MQNNINKYKNQQKQLTQSKIFFLGEKPRENEFLR